MIAALQFKALRRSDAVLTVCVAALLAAGVAFIFSAGYRGDALPAANLYRKQLLWCAAGLASYLVMAAADYRIWIRNAWYVYAVALAALALVEVPGLGAARYGATRWLDLGPIQTQPSEPAKIGVILVLARVLGGPGRDVESPLCLALALAAAGLPVLLILAQPDLGTAMVIPPVTMAVMFVAGVSGAALRRLALAGLLVVLIVVAAAVVPERLGCDRDQCDRIAGMVGLSPYQRMRIMVFLDSDLDPLGAGWNKVQSQIAVGSGGLWGKGYLHGTQNLLGFIPRTVAPTDFVFSVIAEETGFVGSATLIGLYLAVCFAALRAAVIAPDKPGRLLCVGLATLLFCHVFINIAMTIGLMPITGLPLPLVSYGGTFMVGTMAALGMIQNVHAQGRQPR